VDIELGAANVVRAPATGEVTFAGQVPTHGLTVTIATGDGHKASLTHLGTLLVKRGATVKEGDTIAEAGPSGEPEHDVAYVHLGVRVGDDDTYVDPLSLLPSRGAATPPPAPAAPPAASGPPRRHAGRGSTAGCAVPVEA
jgi:murein DD-endopeptidase MepM/ murein hydrolase activator NlpD